MINVETEIIDTLKCYVAKLISRSWRDFSYWQTVQLISDYLDIVRSFINRKSLYALPCMGKIVPGEGGLWDA